MTSLIPMVMLFVALAAREWAFRSERADWCAKEDRLLQRIQAPREVAYKEFAETLPPGAPSEPIWTDEDGWKALGDLPPKASDDDMPELRDWRRAMGMAE